jgi:plasmid stability protein
LSVISVRNIPQETYVALKEIARKSHRSMQEQVRYLIEQEVRLVTDSSLSVAPSWREQLKERRHSDSVAMVREDRAR